MELLHLTESIVSGQIAPLPDGPPGVGLRALVSGSIGSTAISTGTATFQPSGALAAHFHTFSEVITIISGSVDVNVEGREYTLTQFDAIHLPAGTVHAVRNRHETDTAVALWSFASPEPTRTFASESPVTERRGAPAPGDPEALVRFAQAPAYEPAPGVLFRDLSSAAQIRGGYGCLQPGSSLLCHANTYDAAMTIVEGQAICVVQDRRYTLSNHDTAFVPHGRPHSFRNDGEGPMVMLWVCAVSGPDLRPEV
ncbi:MAG: cupin domain-containing protein [Bryobacteraceae bacterium]